MTYYTWRPLLHVRTFTQQSGGRAHEVSPCEDTTEDITLSQCFSKGLSALTKCMSPGG